MNLNVKSFVSVLAQLVLCSCNRIFNDFKSLKVVVVAFLFLTIGTNEVFGQAVGDYGTRYNTGTSYNWNTAANWVVCVTNGTWSGATTASAVPGATNNVWIRTGGVYAANGTPQCTNFTVSSGATFNVAGVSLTFTGTTTINGTIAFSNTNGTKSFGNVIIAGGTWTSSVGEAYGMTNLTLSGSTISGSAAGAFNVSRNFVVSSGTVNNLNAFTIAVTGTSTIDGTASFLSATGTKSFTGLITVSPTGVWDNDNVNEAVAIQGGITNNGTFFAGTGVYTFSTNNQALNGTLAIPNTTITGVTVTNNGSFTVATALSGNGGLTNAATGTLNIGGTSGITTLTANATGNTVNYNGTAQTVKAITYNNLTLSGSGIKTLTATPTINGTLSMEGQATVSGTTNYGASATLQYKGSIGQTTGTEFPATFNGTGGIIINNASGVTLGAARTIGTASDLTLTLGTLTTNATNLLSVTNTSTNGINGGSASSYINGPVRWSLPANLASGTTYNFPVGNTSYLPFSLVNPLTGGTGPVIQIQANNADVSASATFDAVAMSSISHSEYWALNVVSGNFTNSSASVARQTAISPLDAIAGSTATTGSYSHLGGTAGTTGISNSNSIGSNRYFVMAATKPATISTSAISASSFCQGASVSVPYTITGIFNSDNIFTAQLSNASGSFTSPVTIGTLTSTTAGTIPATIPAGTALGSGYRIRVISSNPVKTGTDNGSNLTVVSIPGAPTTTDANICIGTPTSVTLSASGAIAGQKYKWYDAASAGTLLKTSTDNTDNSFTTPTLAATTNYWVSILNAGGCEGSRTQVTATYPSISTDNQSAAGTDSWIGHVYDGTNSGIAYNGAFTNYYGNYTKTETFDESFGGDATCFNITSNSTTQSIYTETFSVRYRMNSTKKGLYVVNMGSDDGNRLTVDGNKIYDDWSDHGVNDHTNVLINLTGSSSLIYDFYENGGGNRVYFNNLTQVLANNLNANTSQSIYIGNSGTAISGDTFGTLATGVTLSGTGYQWTYSTTPAGTRTNISGATGATFTPSTAAAPFNAAGTYYVFRNAVLSSSNNVLPNPYVSTNESNMATLVISPMPTITTSIASLSSFVYAQNNGPSVAQTFTVSGTALTTNIDVTLPVNSNYELSLDGLNYSGNVIVLIDAGGVATAKTIYTRLKAGLVVGAYNDVITASSINAVSKTVSLSGSVTNQPLITVTPNSFTNMSYVLGFGPSTAQTFSVSGSYLQSNITITAPTDFEISKTSATTGFGPSTTLTPTSGTVSSTTIWVRLIAGLSTSTYNENVTLAATYAANATVNCQGVINRATINVSKFTLAGFIYTLNAGPSSTQTFTVSGTSLSANIAIAATTNFEISSDNSTWTSGSLSIIQTGGIVNSTTIYVRMKAGHAVGIISPENMYITTTNAITQSVACSGAVTTGAATISSNPTLNGFFYIVGQGPSVTQSFTVSGTSLTSNLAITAPTDFEISSSGTAGTFTNTFSVTPVGGKVNASLVYIRLKAGLTLTPGTWTETVVLSSTGATNVSVACNGKVVAQPTIVAGPSKPYNVCSGSSAALTSSGTNISSQSWTGPNNFISTDQNPNLGTITATNSGVYTVTGNVSSGINLLTNGDFESGNTGFGSTYTYNAAQGTYGAYWIYNNPITASPSYFINGTDHTPGSGTLMMIVDGAETSGAIVWSETVSVNPNTNYQFSYWAENINSQGNTNYAHLQLYVNNVPVGPVNTASLASWVQFLCNVNSGSSTSLQLTIINTFVGGSGNDFALDDIVLEQVFQVSDDVTLNAVANVTPAVSIVASANPSTSGATVTFTATPTNGGATPTYAWYVGSTLQTGVTGSTFSYVPLNGDQIRCVMTTSLSCYTTPTANSNIITMVINPATNYWKGSANPTTGTDWGTATNWTAGYIPAAGADITYATVSNYGSAAVNDLVLDVNRTQGSLINQTTKNLIIPAGKGLTLNNTITTDNNVNRIYVKSSAASTPNGSLIFYSNNPVYGSVEMYSMAYKSNTPSYLYGNPYYYKWQYFGIPLKTATASPTFDGSYVRKWDETKDTLQHWSSIDNNTIVLPFYGYEITQQAAKTLTFQGQMVNWDWTSPTLTKTAGLRFAGQHVLANPYTAAIDIKKLVFGSNVNATVYLFSTGSYADWSGSNSSSSNPGGYVASTPSTAGFPGIESQIPSMQAFIIQVMNSNSNAYITIPYSSTIVNTARQRVKSQSNSSASTDKVGIYLEIKDSHSIDKLWLIDEASCTSKFDNSWDGIKMLGSPLSPQFYTVESDGIYQIDCSNDLNNKTIGFQPGEESQFTLNASIYNIKTKYAGVYLVDLVENKTIELKEEGTSYSFNTNSINNIEKRFKIVTRNYELKTPDDNFNIKVFGGSGIILAQNISDKNGNIIIYDMAGRYLRNVPVLPNSITTIAGIIPGAYIAKVFSGNDQIAKRLIVR